MSLANIKKDIKVIETRAASFAETPVKYPAVGPLSEAYGLWNTPLKDVGRFISQEGGLFRVIGRSFSTSMGWYRDTYAARGRGNPFLHYIFLIGSLGFGMNVYVNEQTMHNTQHVMEMKRKLNIKV